MSVMIMQTAEARKEPSCPGLAEEQQERSQCAAKHRDSPGAHDPEGEAIIEIELRGGEAAHVGLILGLGHDKVRHSDQVPEKRNRPHHPKVPRCLCRISGRSGHGASKGNPEVGSIPMRCPKSLPPNKTAANPVGARGRCSALRCGPGPITSRRCGQIRPAASHRASPSRIPGDRSWPGAGSA